MTLRCMTLVVIMALSSFVCAEEKPVAKQPARGIVLDVEFHFPKNAKWDEPQIRTQAMQFLLEQLKPIGRGATKAKKDAWFHKDKEFTIAIATEYFSREGTVKHSVLPEKQKKVTEAFRAIAERGKLDRSIFVDSSDLKAILGRSDVVVFDKEKHATFPKVKIDFTATARGGYRIVGGPASGLPQGAIGLDAKIKVTQNGKTVFAEQLPCKWGARLDFVYSPAFEAKHDAAERLLEILSERYVKP